MNEKALFNENMAIRKFCNENERLFVMELGDENNPLTYEQIFEKYNKKYIEFAVKHNDSKRNIYTSLSLDSFEKHFKAVESYK